jgi:hypothetical protein
LSRLGNYCHGVHGQGTCDCQITLSMIGGPWPKSLLVRDVESFEESVALARVTDAMSRCVSTAAGAGKRSNTGYLPFFHSKAGLVVSIQRPAVHRDTSINRAGAVMASACDRSGIGLWGIACSYCMSVGLLRGLACCNIGIHYTGEIITPFGSSCR